MYEVIGCSRYIEKENSQKKIAERGEGKGHAGVLEVYWRMGCSRYMIIIARPRNEEGVPKEVRGHLYIISCGEVKGHLIDQVITTILHQ